ncbi:MAG TPA: NADH:flavin oxidoreductase/NADH oxidase [Puia sp.]|nr:NADH:flavin oxidoreductase/NADH oxidase [Puia sp.]
MAMLFSRLKMKELEFKNRIMVSPMCQYSSVDGFASDWHLVHLGSRAVGGAAIVMQEATAVSPEGRISPDDMGIYHEEHKTKLSQITRFIAEQGSVPGIQLAHAGRKASHASPWKGGKQIKKDMGGWPAVAPSAIAFSEGEDHPLELDKNGIKKIIDDFTAAAKRALESGYRVLEIHAAHGYLLHEFFSPLSNRRNDEYGGSLQNRTRILMEIIDSIKNEWRPGYPLFVRISATDWVEGGWDIDEAVELARQLKARGVDLVDCSSGGNSPQQKIPVSPGYQVPFSGRIRNETGILTGAVGLISTAAQAEEILASGQADIIIMAREFLRDPYFPLHAALELHEDLHWPLQYERGKPRH